jgi:serine protease AprX
MGIAPLRHLFLLSLGSALLFGQQKIDPDLRLQAATSSPLHVIVVLREQPHREVAERVQAGAALRLADAEAEYQRIAAQPLAFEPVVNAARMRRDAVIIETRQEILRQIDSLAGPAQRSLAGRLAKLGATAIRAYQVTNAIACSIPASALDDLEAMPEIYEVAPDVENHALLNFSVPGLGAPAFWTGGITGAGISVGILDSGVFAGNPAFNGVTVTSQAFGDAAVSGKCFNDTSQSSSDMVGHGTHVAGTVAGRGSSDYPAYIGVARGVTNLYNLKIGWSQNKNSSGCGGGASAFDSDVLAAINWAVANTPVRIFNYSYGGKATADDDNGTRLFDQIADNFGLTLSISAGNNGPDGSSLNRPGTGYNNLSVAAMNDAGTSSRSDDSVANFSSRGPTPGGRNKPDIAAPGQVIFAAAYNSNGLIGMQGTSMAAPHIAGSAVLLAQAGITDPLAIRAVLINSSDGTGWTPELGWGYANLTTASQHKDYAEDSIAASAFRFYRGTAAGLFKATMTWNRHIGASGNGTTAYFNPLNLYLYSRGNNTLLAGAESAIDNVKQVSTTLNGDLVIKVKAGSTSFSSVNSETYALAFSTAGFGVAAGPALSASCTPPASVARGSAFTISCSVSNSGGLEAFGVTGAFDAPAGFGTIAGQSFDTVGPAGKVTHTLQLNAPAAAGTYALTLNVSSTSFGEAYTASTKVNVVVGATSAPSLTIDRTSLSFAYSTGGAAPAAQTVAVTSAGGSVAVSVSTSAAWLTASASASATPATVTVGVATSGLTPGTYNGTVAIASNNAANSPQVVAVTLTVSGTSKVSLVTDLITNNAGGGGCAAPKQVNTFAPTDAEAMVWFQVNGAAAGDKASMEWYAPDQSLYQTGSWSPVASAGNWCFWAGINVAGQSPANKPGKWTVKVYWNGTALFSLPFTIVQPVTILNTMTTAALPNGNGCPVPAAQNAFFTTDASVYAWFLVDNTKVGDVASLSWYRPDGKLLTTTTWDPLTDGGSWCFSDYIDVAGDTPATLPGTWTAKGYWNGTQVFTLTFTISPPVVVESWLNSKVKPTGSGCTAPPPSASFVPSDPIALLWFSVSRVTAGDQPSIEWYAPDGSLYDSSQWNPPTSGGNWCFWAWENVAGTDMAAKFGTWTTIVYWNGAPVLTQTFNVVPVNVISSMTTKVIPAGNGCPTPAPAATFVPTDQYAYIWFLTSGAQPGDVAAVKYFAPSGTVYFSTTFDPVPDTQNRCLWAWINVAGTPAATQLGKWTVSTTWNGAPLETAQFNIARTDPGTPTSLSTMQVVGNAAELYGSGSAATDATGDPVPRPGLTGVRTGGVGGERRAEPR